MEFLKETNPTMTQLSSINDQQASVEEDDEGQQIMAPIESISLNSFGTHLLFGEINSMSVYHAINFIIKSNFIFDKENILTMMINTPGGVVTDGFALIDVMETSKIPISTVGIGIIASMGVLIVAAGHKGNRVITKNTEIMAHQFSSMIYGKYHDLVATQKYHVQLEQTFITHFERHTSMTKAQIKDIMFSPSDRWLTPKEAKKYGICDEVREFFI